MSFSFDLNDSFASFAPATPPDGCTQCGMCLPTCPTFIKSQDPEQSPMGRIRLMRQLENSDGEDIDLEKMAKLESCLGCYTCESVCPSRVNFGKMLDKSLAKIHEWRPASRITRMMLWLAARPPLLKSIMFVTYVAQVLGLRGLAAKLGVLKLVGLQRANALLGRLSLPARLTQRTRQAGEAQRVALFTGCFSSVMERTIQQASIDVLNTLGVAVVVPEGQGCCGALHHHSGELETAMKLAQRNIEAFSASKADVIISTSSGCGASLKVYDDWLDGEALPTPVMDINQYLANIVRQREITFEQLSLKIALHTPCTLRQGEGQEEAVVELLQMIPGLEVVPLPGEPRCCGAGGSQMLSQPDMADALRDDIVEEIKPMGVDMLISSNLGCAMHLRNGLAQAGVNIPLQHPVQLMAQAIKA